MKKLAVLCVALSCVATAFAGIGGGYVGGPDDGFLINMTLSNSGASTSDVISAAIDGTTSSAYTIVWDDIWNQTGPAGASTTPSGLDTSVLTLTFGDAADGFNPGESTSFALDPDKLGDSSWGAYVRDLIGVNVLFTFRDSSTWQGAFVDDPGDGAGLVLQQVAVPAPAAILLCGLGTGLVAGLRRRRAL